MKQSYIKYFAVALLFTVAGCASTVNPVSGKMDRGVMSEQEEISSGRQYHQEILKEYTPYNNPALQAYVNAIGQKLAAQSQRPNLPWTFTVVDSPEINAFAVQGGYIYVTRGLMAYMGSEAELAGVIGHEIGHVTARHGARADRDQKIASGIQILGTLLGAYVAGEQGANTGAQIFGGGATTGFLLPRSREHELQADRLGAEYLQRVNFDPDVMINVIQVLKAQETFSQDEARAAGRQMSDTPNWLRTHPANDQRLQEMRKVADQYTGKYQDAGRQRYLQTINGMTFGEGREQGVTRGQNFYHEPLGFVLRAPQGFSIQNAQSELTILADNMQAAVAVRISSNTRGDHNAAIKALLAPDQGRVEQTTINGLRATNFIGAKQNNPIDATVISLGNNDFVFQKMQKAEARGSYDAILREAVASFRAFTPADAANAKPYTIRTVALPRTGAPFTDLARDAARIAPQIKNAEGQIRLLNQVYPQGNIAPGQLVKTIQ
jgi:predicted Zn-dependent protease